MALREDIAKRKSKLDILWKLTQSCGREGAEMYSYATVETALVAAFGVRPEKLGALRGRIKHFQKLGISPSAPGKGRRISYEVLDIFRWALCLEFAEFGVDPTLIKTLLLFAWPRVETALSNSDPDKRWLLLFYPNFMSFWPEKISAETTIPGFYCILVRDLSELASLLGSERAKHDPLNERFGSINLGRLWRDVTAALAKVPG